jgi:predicted porin
MKKIGAVIFGLSASACGIAHADGGVTLYGIMDSSVEISNVGNGTVVRMDSGGLLASRIGLRGTEDIGGGNHINFVLEQGISTTDGKPTDPTRAFSRQAWVGASGAWGEVRFGRQNSPLYVPLSGRFDAFTFATIASGLDSFQSYDVRNDNSVFYQTPTIHGLTAQVMVSLRSQSTAPSNGIESYHFAAEYVQGPVDFGIGYQKVANDAGTADFKAIFAGGSYGFGPLRIFGVYTHQSQTDGTIEKDVVTTSASYFLTPASMVSAGYAYVHDKTQAAKNADQIGLMYWYFLSKRTTLYAAASFLDNRSRGTYTMNGASTVGIPVAYAGATARGLQLGIQQRF